MTEHSRTYDWSEPAPLAAQSAAMDGLDFLQALVDGRLPRASIQQTLDFRIVEVAAGRAVFAGVARRWMMNPNGGVHGSWYAALLDSCMGCAVHSTLPKGWGYTTLEYRVNLVRAASEAAGELRAEGRVLHRGGRTATADGRLTDAAGRLYAHGVTTCLLFAPEKT